MADALIADITAFRLPRSHSAAVKPRLVRYAPALRVTGGLQIPGARADRLVEHAVHTPTLALVRPGPRVPARGAGDAWRSACCGLVCMLVPVSSASAHSADAGGTPSTPSPDQVTAEQSARAAQPSPAPGPVTPLRRAPALVVVMAAERAAAC
jgi:hypothetical protein